MRCYAGALPSHATAHGAWKYIGSSPPASHVQVTDPKRWQVDGFWTTMMWPLQKESGSLGTSLENAWILPQHGRSPGRVGSQCQTPALLTTAPMICKIDGSPLGSLCCPILLELRWLQLQPTTRSKNWYLLVLVVCCFWSRHMWFIVHCCWFVVCGSSFSSNHICCRLHWWNHRHVVHHQPFQGLRTRGPSLVSNKGLFNPKAIASNLLIVTASNLEARFIYLPRPLKINWHAPSPSSRSANTSDLPCAVTGPPTPWCPSPRSSRRVAERIRFSNSTFCGSWERSARFFRWSTWVGVHRSTHHRSVDQFPGTEDAIQRGEWGPNDPKSSGIWPKDAGVWQIYPHSTTKPPQ